MIHFSRSVEHSSQGATPSHNNNKAHASGRGGSRAFDRDTIADAVEKAASSVVNISVNSSTRQWGPLVLPGATSTGSGFIIAQSDGVAKIVTNAHVVVTSEGTPSSIAVTLHDGSTHAAVVESVDEETDMCVLQMQTNAALPVLPLGDSNTLRAGDWVIVLGSPLMLRNTVTVGVVCGLIIGRCPQAELH